MIDWTKVKDRTPIIPEKSLPTLLGIAQKIFNIFIRKRDQDNPCIYCSQPMNPKDKLNPIEAAHFYPVSTCQALRFDEENVFGAHKFCNQDNNRDAITFNVKARLGDIESLYVKSHSLVKFSRFEVLEIIEKYKLK